MMLGQKRMASLGHPAASSASVLEAVLRLTGSSVTREDELCTESCQVRRGQSGLRVRGHFVVMEKIFFWFK